MSNQELAALRTAKGRIEGAQDKLAWWIEFLAGARPATAIPGELSIDGTSLKVSVYGFTAVARPRIVRAEPGDFAAELAFYLVGDEDAAPLWCCYLDRVGTLHTTAEPSGASRLGDAGHAEVKLLLLFHVTKALLASSAFAPRTR